MISYSYNGINEDKRFQIHTLFFGSFYGVLQCEMFFNSTNLRQLLNHTLIVLKLLLEHGKLNIKNIVNQLCTTNGQAFSPMTHTTCLIAISQYKAEADQPLLFLSRSEIISLNNASTLFRCSICYTTCSAKLSKSLYSYTPLPCTGCLLFAERYSKQSTRCCHATHGITIPGYQVPKCVD